MGQEKPPIRHLLGENKVVGLGDVFAIIHKKILLYENCVNR